ncbi:MAG: pitrilysin family protein [Firmicutes bacterium]|nr:pitrilysin family protein [Bacillota bacterium]
MIERHTLPNGLRIVLEDIPFVRSVSMGIWIGTGSRDERPEQSGVSHLLEHMFFKGTARMNARELAEVFDGIGGQVNAYTSKEYTCFHAKVLDEHAQLALSVLADMLYNSLLDPVELEREKMVVLEEIKMYEDNPEEAVHDLIIEETFANHPLATNILGTVESLEGLDRDALLLYIHERYTPDNIVISVCGHIDSAKMLNDIEALFGKATRTVQSGSILVPTFIPAQVFRARPVEQAHVCLGLPGLHYEHPDSYAMVLLNSILGSSSSSRLFQEIRENRGMAYSVFSYHSAYRDCGLFAIYFGANPAQSQAVIELVEEMIGQWRRDGVTDGELRRAKDQLKGSLMLSLESTSSRMSRLGKNELLLSRQVELDEMIDDIEAVTEQEVGALIQTIFQGDFSFVAMGPGDHPLRAPAVIST